MSSSLYSPRAARMRHQIKDLFAGAPKIRETDAPAVECQVILRSGYRAVGALSIVEFEDDVGELLRFLSIGQAQGRDEVIAVEHFFDYDDLECIAIPRAMEQPQASPIIMG